MTSKKTFSVSLTEIEMEIALAALGNYQMAVPHKNGNNTRVQKTIDKFYKAMGVDI